MLSCHDLLYSSNHLALQFLFVRLNRRVPAPYFGLERQISKDGRRTDTAGLSRVLLNNVEYSFCEKLLARHTGSTRAA